VAFVSREAISAGAFISLACDEIYMQPGTQIGDAMPVMAAPGGGYQPIPKAEREKAETYLRAKMRSMAEQNGYSPEMAEAMVSLSLEVWLIRDKNTGELRFFQPHDTAQESEIQQALRILGQEGGGLNPDELLKEPWEFLRRVDRRDELLTMTASEALKWGFCKEILPSREALAERFNVQGEMTFLEDTTEEKIAAFLTNPAITSLLLLIGIGAVYAEFNTPGLGIAAAVALAAFTILIGSHFMLGLALWWEVMLFVAGIILIGVEIFVIPGFGVAGISGIALCAMSLLAMMIPNAPLEIPWPRTDLMWGYFRRGGFALTIGFLGSVALMVVLSRILPKSSLSNKLFLAPAAEYHEPPTTEQHPIHSIKAGDEGVAATTCRPSGQVRIGEHLLDAVADGTMITSGTKVRVLRNDGNRLVIEPTET
jgi:membrane-bound serine protease (ClpP class)